MTRARELFTGRYPDDKNGQSSSEEKGLLSLLGDGGFGFSQENPPIEKSRFDWGQWVWANCQVCVPESGAGIWTLLFDLLR